MFCTAGDDVFFGVVVGVGLVSIIDEIVSDFATSAQQTCGHDKMRHFLREEACFNFLPFLIHENRFFFWLRLELLTVSFPP